MGIYGHRFDHLMESNIDIDSIFLEEQNYLDSINISPQIIQKYCIAPQIVTEEYVEQVLMEAGDPVNGLAKFFLNIGVSSVNITKTVKKTATDIANIIKTKGVGKESRVEIRKAMENFWKEAGEGLDIMTDPSTNKKFAGLDSDKVNKSIALLMYHATIASITLTIGELLFGDVGHRIIATIMGPLLEENAKKIAIKGEFVKEYTIVFNTFEFSQYVLTYAPMVGLVPMIKVRLVGVGMHLATTLIQYLTSNPKILAKFNITEEDDKNKASVIGHTIALIIHGCYNGSSRWAEFLSKFAGIN